MNNTGFSEDKEVLRTVEALQTLALSLIEMGKFSTIDSNVAQSLFRQNLECSQKYN